MSASLSVVSMLSIIHMWQQLCGQSLPICAKSADLLQSSCSSCLYVAVLHVDSAGEETQPEDTAQQQQQQQTKPKISATNDDTSRHPDACQCSMCLYLSTPAIVAA